VEIFFCILFAALVAVYVYANYKKRNGIIWFLLSILITPPLALLILLNIGSASRSAPRTKIGSIVLVCMICLVIGCCYYYNIILYETQHIKTKMAEVVNSMSNVASAVAIYHEDENSWPHCDGVIAIQDSLGLNIPTKRISSITVTSPRAEEIIIKATIKDIDLRVDGRNLTLTGKRSERDILWVWGGTVPPPFVPKK
jgi:uncharacterized membrane protein